MYISLQIEEITFSLQSDIRIYTHIHIMNDVLNCFDRSLDVFRET